MPVYMIFIRERIRDRGEIEEYGRLAPAAAAGREMKPLSVYGKLETLEGPEAQGVVLLEFPTHAEAMAWYNSEEYREARRHRFLGADYRVFALEGT
ncbi:DUF1330 domain-containing protein [Geobacter sp. SVR]|uniref:DUF1330 domain-containing protein n=1 Tax=Geobacter sp. SVR TaxID=2495594 RepID=UPI00143F0276|nr:DUF1330 domain-containing protein [Geobacter sp. SVR]BCS54421.1 hypothetical protein GSVR_27290 [Geobacter sp. SVR]GCF87652.1 hypothetical protein GSbR_42520 [Geobacter sp. SVR]